MINVVHVQQKTNNNVLQTLVHMKKIIIQHKSTKMVSHSILQNWCLHMTNTDRSKTL